jgi:anti-sigma regulatory factor (Ser/Thr protein kinase)
MAPSFARGHAERRCSGACPQQARSSSAPYPLEGPARGLCPGPGSGKRRARQLRRSTPLSRHEGQALRADHARALLLVAALARPANSSASAADVAACQIPTRYPPCGAVWLAHVSPIRGGEEPGCTIRKEVASGRGSCVELTISASPFELAGLRRAARDALGEVPTQVADDMLLALDEAATNAILHGSDGGGPIQVAVRVRDAWVEASVLDHGPTEPPRPVSTTDRRSGGGWGLWLLRCLVDEVRLERVEGGTRVTLRRRVRPPSAVTGVGRHPSTVHAVS